MNERESKKPKNFQKVEGRERRRREKKFVLVFQSRRIAENQG